LAPPQRRADGAVARVSEQVAAPRLAYADTRLGQMHWRIWAGPPDGSETPVVCLHPFPYSGRFFDSFAVELSRTVSVLAPDLMGYGGSAPLSEPASIEDHALAVADALQDLGVARFVPLGYHTGSAVAGELAIIRAKRAPRAVFVTYPFLSAEDRQHQLAGLGRGSLLSEDLSSLQRRWRFTVHNRPAGSPLHNAVNNFIDELRAGDAAWFGFQSMFQYRPEDRLPKIMQPVVVISPEGSANQPTQAAAALLPDPRHAEAGGLGKGLFERQAPQLARLVARDVV
jgi:pimeloyl-ACP methyl ester carboxylesterase